MASAANRSIVTINLVFNWSPMEFLLVIITPPFKFATNDAR